MADSTATNTLLLQAISIHAIFSTLHVSSRYLQVYANPNLDGQAVLSSTRGFATLIVFLTAWINRFLEKESNEDVVARDGVGSGGCGFGSGRGSGETGCLENGTPIGGTESMGEQDHDSLGKASGSSNGINSVGGKKDASPHKLSVEGHALNENAEVSNLTLRRKKVFYTLLFGTIATCRASLNFASAKYTHPYYISLIASFSPIMISIADKFFFKSPFPPLLWPTAFLSAFGAFLIALSQSSIIDHFLPPSASNADVFHGTNTHTVIVTPKDNTIGCTLQLISVVLSAIARIFMKHTEHILTSTHIVQTNNISNCVFPLLYTLIHNPRCWLEFHSLFTNPSTLLAWCTISIGIYSFATARQIRLVRRLGPGVYSSWVAVRVLCSIILSAVVLGEGVKNWLEWVGIGVMTVTISVYSVKTRKWMEMKRKKVAKNDVVMGRRGDETNGEVCTSGEEEMVSLKEQGENQPLLGTSSRTNGKENT